MVRGRPHSDSYTLICFFLFFNFRIQGDVIGQMGVSNKKKIKVKITNPVYFLHSDVKKWVQGGNRSCLTSHSHSGTELGWIRGSPGFCSVPLPTPRIVILLQQVRNQYLPSRKTALATELRLCLQTQSQVEVWLCKKSLKDWEIFIHLGGYFFQVKGACKPQLKSCDTSNELKSKSPRELAPVLSHIRTG